MEMLGQFLSPFWLAFSILALLLVITRVSWWTGHWYFPGRAFCMPVHKNLPRWFEGVRRVLNSFETPTVPGLLSAALLLAIVVLNVTLLAQMFELWLPSGYRIRIPYIGTYGTFPLIAGFLFGLSQVAFSVLRKMASAKGQRAIHLVVIIAVTIAFEAGLNLYRTRLLTSGAEPASPTFWDSLVFNGGPILAGFLGVIVPVAEVLLSPPAVLEFLQPVITDIVVSVRFLFSSTFLGLVWLFFGFHDKKPVALPGPVGRLMQRIKGLKHDAASLKVTLEEVRGMALGNAPPAIGQFHHEVSELRGSAKTLNLAPTVTEPGDFREKSSSFNELVDGIADRRSLHSTIRDINSWSSVLDSEAELVKSGIEDIDRRVRKAYDKHSVFQKSYDEYRHRLDRARACCKSLMQQTVSNSEWERLHSAVASAIGGKLLPNAGLAPAEADELREIGSLRGHRTEHEKEWGLLVLGAVNKELLSVSSESATIKSIVTECCNDLDLLEAQMSDRPQPPLETEVTQIKRDLVLLDNRIAELEEKLRGHLSGWRSELRTKAFKLHAFVVFARLTLPRYRGMRI